MTIMTFSIFDLHTATYGINKNVYFIDEHGNKVEINTTNVASSYSRLITGGYNKSVIIGGTNNDVIGGNNNFISGEDVDFNPVYVEYKKDEDTVEDPHRPPPSEIGKDGDYGFTRYYFFRKVDDVWEQIARVPNPRTIQLSTEDTFKKYKRFPSCMVLPLTDALFSADQLSLISSFYELFEKDVPKNLSLDDFTNDVKRYAKQKNKMTTVSDSKFIRLSLPLFSLINVGDLDDMYKNRWVLWKDYIKCSYQLYPLPPPKMNSLHEFGYDVIVREPLSVAGFVIGGDDSPLVRVGNHVYRVERVE